MPAKWQSRQGAVLAGELSLPELERVRRLPRRGLRPRLPLCRRPQLLLQCGHVGRCDVLQGQQNKQVPGAGGRGGGTQVPIIPMENPYCSCKLTRVQAAAHHVGAGGGVQRDHLPAARVSLQLQ